MSFFIDPMDRISVQVAKHGCVLTSAYGGHYEIHSSVRADDEVYTRVRRVSLKQLRDPAALDGICRGIRLDTLQDAAKALREQLGH